MRETQLSRSFKHASQNDLSVGDLPCACLTCGHDFLLCLQLKQINVPTRRNSRLQVAIMLHPLGNIPRWASVQVGCRPTAWDATALRGRDQATVLELLRCLDMAGRLRLSKVWPMEMLSPTLLT